MWGESFPSQSKNSRRFKLCVTTNVCIHVFVYMRAYMIYIHIHLYMYIGIGQLLTYYTNEKEQSVKKKKKKIAKLIAQICIDTCARR